MLGDAYDGLQSSSEIGGQGADVLASRESQSGKIGLSDCCTVVSCTCAPSIMCSHRTSSQLDNTAPNQNMADIVHCQDNLKTVSPFFQGLKMMSC